MNFSQMALEKLNAASPGLSKYVVAFKDMTSELPENAGVEVGAFVLRNGGTVFFIPAIAKGGVMYPLDSIYLSDRKSFFPLTKKTVEQIRTTQNENVGKPVRTPPTALRNPDLKDLVVPPRTGKFVYASSSRLSDVISMSDPVVRMALADTLEKDAGLSDLLQDSYDVQSLIATLRDVPTLNFEKKAEVEVIVDGDGLDHAAVQDILNKGYHVRGQHAVTRVAVESYGAHSYTKLNAAEPGHAYLMATITGEDVPIAILPSSQEVSAQKTRGQDDGYHMVCDKDGNIGFLNGGIVIRQQEVPYEDIIANLQGTPAPLCYNLLDQGGDNTLVFFDGLGYFAFNLSGPADLQGDVVHMTGSIRQKTGGTLGNCRVIVHPGMHGLSNYVRNERGGVDVYLNSSCVAFGSFTNRIGELAERSLTGAINRAEHRAVSVLPEYHSLAHQGGTFAIDGQITGDAAKTVERLVTDFMLQPSDAENFIKSASERAMVGIHMSKQAEASIPTPIPEYGTKVPESAPITGGSRDRLRGQNDRIRAAASTKDKEVLETTIISELLNDPNMYATIGEYLPELRSAVDRMGRILFLIRMSSDKLSDNMDPEALSGMVTNLKNSYSNLGESFLKLEQLASNV